MRKTLATALVLSAIGFGTANAQERHVIINPDGSRTVLVNRGGHFGQGWWGPGHRWVRWNGQGRVVVDHPNGSRTVIRRDGTRVHVSANGDRRVITRPDGSREIQQRNF